MPHEQTTLTPAGDPPHRSRDPLESRRVLSSRGAEVSYPIKPGDTQAWDAYEKRVQALESEGLTRSDAEGVADAELIMEKMIEKAEADRDRIQDR